MLNLLWNPILGRPRPEWQPMLNPDHPLTRGLVACLLLNEKGGYAWNMANMAPCSLGGGAIFDPLGGVAFPTVGWVQLNSEMYIDTFTMVAEVSTTLSGSQTVYGGGNNNAQFRVRSSGALELLDQQQASIGVSSLTIASNTRAVVGVTYNTSGNYAFYVNSRFSNSGTTVRDVTTSDTGGRLGHWVGSSSERWMGTIYWFMGYNRVLSPTEMAQFVNPWGSSGLPRFLITAPVGMTIPESLLTFQGTSALGSYSDSLSGTLTHSVSLEDDLNA